jgi:hypothetical protein
MGLEAQRRAGNAVRAWVQAAKRDRRRQGVSGSNGGLSGRTRSRHAPLFRGDGRLPAGLGTS